MPGEPLILHLFHVSASFLANDAIPGALGPFGCKKLLLAEKQRSLLRLWRYSLLICLLGNPLESESVLLLDLVMPVLIQSMYFRHDRFKLGFSFSADVSLAGLGGCPHMQVTTVGHRHLHLHKNYTKYSI